MSAESSSAAPATPGSSQVESAHIPTVAFPTSRGADRAVADGVAGFLRSCSRGWAASAQETGARRGEAWVDGVYLANAVEAVGGRLAHVDLVITTLSRSHLRLANPVGAERGERIANAIHTRLARFWRKRAFRRRAVAGQPGETAGGPARQSDETGPAHVLRDAASSVIRRSEADLVPDARREQRRLRTIVLGRRELTSVRKGRSVAQQTAFAVHKRVGVARLTDVALRATAVHTGETKLAVKLVRTGIAGMVDGRAETVPSAGQACRAAIAALLAFASAGVTDCSATRLVRGADVAGAVSPIVALRAVRHETAEHRFAIAGNWFLRVAERGRRLEEHGHGFHR